MPEDRRNYTWLKEYLDQIIDSNKTEHENMMKALSVHIDAHVALNGRLGSLENWRAWSKGVFRTIGIIVGGATGMAVTFLAVLNIIKLLR